jgi:LuxR family transcriptional regulator, maltose regulon positive regulatory protein
VTSPAPAQAPLGLIRTRFYRPALPGDFVARPRLVDQLNRGLDRPLTLVSAPAGFGKSILVRSWLDSCARPSAWLSLDENVDNLGAFLPYFLSAIQTIAPAALPQTQAMLTGFSLPSIDVLASSLINELDEIDDRFVVVLEDYHTIHEAAIHELLAALLHNPLPNMHLVLVTRQDPPLALGLMRARGLVAEVRVQDLRFATDESATFMQNVLGFPLPDATLAELMARTEGWITSLRLVALALRYSDDIGGRLGALQGLEHNRYVADYLMSEVLDRVPSELVEFLLRTSILDRMCAPICNALLGHAELDARSQHNLEWLEENNLFTTPLDAEGRWYRYHHLLQGFLRSELARRHGAREITLLHARASAWCATHGLLEEALKHALLGNEMPAAVRLMADHRHALMDTEQWQLHERLLRMFPAGAIASDPDLTLMEAWSARLGRQQFERFLELLDRAESLVAQRAEMPEHATQLRGEIDALRITGVVEAASDPEGAIMLGQRALATTPRAWYFVRAVAWLWLAIAYQMTGRLDQAYATLAEGQPEDKAPDGSVRARVVGSRSFVAWMAGDLHAIPPIATHLLDVGEHHQRRESLGWGHYLRCVTAYQHNDLRSAEVHAQALETMRYIATPLAYLQSAFAFALIHHARGNPDRAQAKLDLAFAFVHETDSKGLLPLANAFKAELALRQGNLDAASQWAATNGPFVPLTFMPFFYAPQLTLSKILLAQDTPASRSQAAAELSRLHAFVTSLHNTYFTVEVLALKALLAYAQGNKEDALAALEQAVLLARPGGIVRLFVDLGPRMAGLLGRLAAAGAADAYLQQLLVAFTAKESPSQLEPSAPPRVPAGMVEPLTRREQEVLHLLTQRLTAGEIAQQLFLSEQTVKRHRANIYQKLGANSRRDAIAAALAFGILPAPA